MGVLSPSDVKMGEGGISVEFRCLPYMISAYAPHQAISTSVNKDMPIYSIIYKANFEEACMDSFYQLVYIQENALNNHHTCLMESFALATRIKIT